MILVLADQVKSIKSVVALEIPSLVTNKSKLLFAGSLGIIRSAAENKKKTMVIKLNNCTDVDIKDNKVSGCDTFLDAHGSKKLRIDNNEIIEKVRKIDKKWYEDRMFILDILAIIVTIFFGLVGYYYKN